MTYIKFTVTDYQTYNYQTFLCKLSYNLAFSQIIFSCHQQECTSPPVTNLWLLTVMKEHVTVNYVLKGVLFKQHRPLFPDLLSDLKKKLWKWNHFVKEITHFIKQQLI